MIVDKPKIYNPVTDLKVPFEDAVKYLMREYGIPYGQAELSVSLARGGDGQTLTELDDGSVIVQQA
jgi:hypothetical protein